MNNTITPHMVKPKYTPLSQKEEQELKEAIEDVKKGRVKSIEKVAAELKVKLR